MRKLSVSIVVLTAVGIASLSFVNTRRIALIESEPFERAELRIRIDVSERTLTLEEDGAATHSWPVTVGTSEHPTPRGTFAVRRVIWNPRWVPPDSDWAKKEKPREPGDPRNPMGRVKIFFREPTYYIHGTSDEQSIGSSASHGCVRMRNDDVIELSRLLIDLSEAPVEPGLIRRLLNNVRRTREIALPAAVPLIVQS